jgi:hypothetical protein
MRSDKYLIWDKPEKFHGKTIKKKRGCSFESN